MPESYEDGVLHREQAWADAHGLVLHAFNWNRWNPPGTILLILTARGHGAALGGGEQSVYGIFTPSSGWRRGCFTDVSRLVRQRG